MRERKTVFVAAAILLSLVTSDALAQPGGRLRGRLFGGARNRDQANNPGSQATDRAPRTDGQFRQGLEKLGGRLQQAIDSGALDSLLGQAGAPVPRLPNVASTGLASRSELRAQFSGTEPFTPAWYANHPQAWRFAHPHADAWAVTSVAAATAWLGIEATTGATAAYPEQVHTSETLDPEAAAAPQLEGDNLPLGVFALAPAGAEDPSALLQLAIGRDGQLRGNYYDLVLGSTQPISGSLDKHTQLATFKVASPEAAEFEAALVSLTRPDGSIRLRFAGGEVSDWQLARYESGPSAAAPAPSSN